MLDSSFEENQLGTRDFRRATVPHRTAATELLDVVEVEARPNHMLRLLFENGERRIFDMTPYLEKRPFVSLKNSPLFAQARVEYGTVVWPGNIDIAPETLYDRSCKE